MDLAAVRQSPRDAGTLELIVRRPAVGAREVLDVGRLDPVEGLAGDDWSRREHSPSPDVQLTIMNARAIALVAPDRTHWPLAGDQLYIDFDLSVDHLPAGARLAVGDETVLEVTALPHTACGKFVRRFGTEAAKVVNSPEGRALRLRGLHAKVVQGGTVRVGDIVRKL